MVPFFLLVLFGHFVFGAWAYVEEHGSTSGYLIEWVRDVLENWQSELGEALVLTIGLTWLRFAGSPQSREGDERLEAKVDEVLRRLQSRDTQATLRTE